MTASSPKDQSSSATSATAAAAHRDAAALSSSSSSPAGRQPAAAAAAAAQLAGAKMNLRRRLRQFDDFPIPGTPFIDIMPLFADAHAHAALVSALEFQIATAFPGVKPDVVVGLDARGFLFGPTLALRLGAGFAAVRKEGKLPGPCVTAEYVKEYGRDSFQMQVDGVGEGQRVLIVDDIIATGGSAKAAADLVTQLKGEVVGYLFVLEIPGLGGRGKLGPAPVGVLFDDA